MCIEIAKLDLVTGDMLVIRYDPDEWTSQQLTDFSNMLVELYSGITPLFVPKSIELSVASLKLTDKGIFAEERK